MAPELDIRVTNKYRTLILDYSFTLSQLNMLNLKHIKYPLSSFLIPKTVWTIFFALAHLAFKLDTSSNENQSLVAHLSYSNSRILKWRFDSQ